MDLHSTLFSIIFCTVGFSNWPSIGYGTKHEEGKKDTVQSGLLIL